MQSSPHQPPCNAGEKHNAAPHHGLHDKGCCPVANVQDAGDTWYKAEDGSHWSFPLATSGASSPLAAAPQPPAHQAAAAAPAAQSAPTPAPQTTNKSMPPAPTKVQSSTTKSPAAAPNAADKMPMAPSRQPPAVLPVVNVELQNLWAYRMWEEAGGCETTLPLVFSMCHVQHILISFSVHRFKRRTRSPALLNNTS